ncbi:MAG: mechanosensitive ion channel family protein [Alphaproteobacteria bacterium]
MLIVVGHLLRASARTQRLAFTLATLLLPLFLSIGVRAQDQPDEAAPAVMIPDDLTSEQFQALLGRLSDDQVRDLVIRQYEASARADAPTSDGSTLAMMTGMGDSFRDRLQALLQQVPHLSDAFALIDARIRAFGGYGIALLGLATTFGAGFLARHLWRRRAVARQERIAARNVEAGAYASPSVLLDAALYLILDLSSVLVFYLAAMAVLYTVWYGHPDARLFLTTYVAAMTGVLVVRSAVEFCFPQRWTTYRLIPFSDELTTSFRNWAIVLAIIWSFGFLTCELLTLYGVDAELHQLIVIAVATVFVITLLVAIFHIRPEVTTLIAGERQTGFSRAVASNWHLIAIGYALLLWVLGVGNIVLHGQASASGSIGLKSLLLILGVPALDLIFGHFIRGQLGQENVVGQAIRQTVRVLLIVGAAAIFLSLWGLDIAWLRTLGVAGWLLEALIDVGVIALVGYAVWQLVRALIDTRLAEEAPAEESELGEGEGGGAGATRAATLLPLLRSSALVIIAIVCAFTAASSLGVNIAPLIAGAGVVGIAIGFGAQTLVRDIVSGIFFLIDDAFRRGEYIEMGDVRGTVEKISVRSMQLRHHNGPLHTIPFGEITHLTNMSRDWVLMKLPLRVTYDTDVEKLRKMIKKLGQELLDDPELGPKFLQPLKSQGVIQMEDSAMIVRVKFMTRPGDQWTLRNKVFSRLRELFEREGIKFAHREVTVRIADHEEGQPLTETERKAATAAARSLVESDGEQPGMAEGR